MFCIEQSEKSAMIRLISSAVSIASKAGTEIRRIIKTGKLDVVDKGIQDYQTEADRSVQRMIVVSLKNRFPKCAIVGEEELADDPEADVRLMTNSYDEEILKLSIPSEFENITEEEITVWVDPLDGTTDFVRGHLEHVTVLIGISVNGRSVAGVIHQPFYGFSSNEANMTGRTIWSLVGLGCFGVVRKFPPEDKLIITTTSSHGNADIEDSIAALKPDEVIKVGGAGYKVLQVIEGNAHSYIFPSNGCKRWDTSAPEAILESLGGQLTDIFGNRIEYEYRIDGDYRNHLGIVASANPKIHSKMIENFPEAVKNRLSAMRAQKLKSKF